MYLQYTHWTLIVALNGAGVIPAEEAQAMGRVLREDQLTTTRCKLEIKRAGRLYMGGREVGRVGMKPEDICCQGNLTSCTQ